MSWPDELLERDFRPAKVAHITGRTQQLRRKWEERHFDFPLRDRLFGGDGETQWYSWVGVQMIALFGQVMEDTHSSDLARAALMVDPVENFPRRGTEFFEQDWRHRDEDCYLICNLSLDKPAFFLSGPNISSPPARAYIINLSDLQRELFDRLQEVPD